jgi:excisionase family DNA binding protein
MTLSKSSKMGDSFFENLAVKKTWLSTIDASKILGISPNALRILVCRGKVKFYKFGKRLRFRIEDIECLLKKGQ